MRIDLGAFACLALLLLPVAGLAQPIDDQANLNFYLVEPDYDGCMTFDDMEIGTCENLVSDPVPGLAYLWIVASREGDWPTGIGGIQFGVEYSGVDVLGWSLCTGGLEIPSADWPASGSGNAITWDDGCYDPPIEVAKVGYFQVADGSSGAMVFTVDPRIDDGIIYAECIGPDIFVIPDMNAGPVNLAMGTDPVCGPNGGTPTHETTWGRIKDGFR